MRQVDKAQTDNRDTSSTPLFMACQKGHTEVVRLLLAHDGIAVNRARLVGGTTSLYVACLKGHTEVVRLLLAHDRIDVNKALTSDGATPLLIACQISHTEVVRLLLAHDGIDTNAATTDDGATPLIIACQEGHTEVVRLLLAQEGIAVNQPMMNGGGTPLYNACDKDHSTVVALLLQQQGISINQGRADDGATPLYTVCDGGFLNCIRMLLARPEIDVNKSMLDGDTPLYAACVSGKTAAVRMLLQHGDLDVNKARSDDGANPLYIACDKGHVDIVRLLLADGRADLNHKNLADGLTPLHAAAFNDRLLVAQLLVFHGASTTPADNEGDTPEDLAAMENYEKMVEWLQAIAEWTPLRVAAACRLHTDVAAALRQGRVDPDDTAATSVKDIVGVIATSKAEPAALPWRDAPPICKKTIKLMRDATRGWHRTTHWLHHAHVREAAFTVVCVARRLEVKEKDAPPPELARPAQMKQAAIAVAEAEASGPATPLGNAMPVLPIEMWFHAMSFVMRSWWGVGSRKTDLPVPRGIRVDLQRVCSSSLLL